MTFGKKTRILDDMKTGEVKNMREEVCRIMNEHAKANGADWYVYAGKFAEVVEGHIPTAHIPVNAPRELREAMEAENLAIVEARPPAQTHHGRVEKNGRANGGSVAGRRKRGNPRAPDCQSGSAPRASFTSATCSQR